MERQRLTKRVVGSGPGTNLFGELGGSPEDAVLATVIHGTYAEALPVAQMSVAQVRSRFRDRCDLLFENELSPKIV